MKQKENQKLESIEGLFPKKIKNNEIKDKIGEIKKFKEKIKRKDLKYAANKYIPDFQQCETIRSFGDRIYPGKINIDKDDILLENIVKFHNKSRRKKEKKEK